MKASLHPLYHRFLNLLKKNQIQNKKLLLAVSGGLDSTALLSLMTEAQKILRLQITACTVHHGGASPCRDQAGLHLISLCESLNVPFLYNHPPAEQKNPSEEFLRKFRYKHLKKWQKKTGSHFLVLAHNADDLLETRLIRLIRGTGFQGLSSMHFLKDKTLRPFIFFTRKEIKDYIKKQKWQWVEDPTNKQTNFLRNWIRNQWLPQLEKKRKGSVRCLARSLERICQEEATSHDFQNVRPWLFTREGLNRKFLDPLPAAEQKKAIAQYMKQNHLKNYSENHIQEILKMCKSSRAKFHLLGKKWRIDSPFLKIETNKDRKSKEAHV